MLAKLKHFLHSHLHAETAEEKTKSLHLAAASMLLEVVYADEKVSNEEANLLPHVLQNTIGLSETECQELLNQAEVNHAQAISLYEFTNEINNAFNLEQKQLLVLAMWQLAYADGSLCQYEDQIIRRTADLLYLKHSELIQLRNNAMEMR